MKRTLLAVCSLAFVAVVHGQGMGGPHGGWHRNPLEEMSSSLDLSDAQKAKIQPVIDQAKPQVEAIHREAMEKMKAVIENSIAQIRPLLTPEQQIKLDAIRKAHEDLRTAMRELHNLQTR